MSKYSDQIAALEAPQAQSVPQSAPKSKYADQIAALDAPAPSGQAPQAAPGFFAPSKMASRAVQGTESAIPLLDSSKALLGGKNPYTNDVAGWSRAAGDIGGVAGTIASGGIAPLAKVVGLAGALNALGVPQAADWLGKKEEDLAATNLPSKVLGIEGLGDALNVGSRAVGASADTLTQVLPYLLAGKATGAAEPAAARLGESLKTPEPSSSPSGFDLSKLPPELRQEAPKPELETPALTEAQQQAKALQEKGYPVREAHLTPGDTSLKSAMSHPGAQAEAQAYQAALDKAMQADVSSALDTGGKTSQQLGEDLGKAHDAALDARSAAYKKMLSMADNPRGEVNTGTGELTHAGKEFQKMTDADLQAKGFDPNADASTPGLQQTMRMKALTSGLTQYDVPAELNAKDVTAALRFSDIASQKAAQPTQLAGLASNFAKTSGLFEPGESSGFLKDTQRRAVDLAGNILKARDAQIGPAGTPAFPEWAAQRANWAKSADLVDQLEGKLSAPKTRITGEQMYSQSKISPEQIFQKEFADSGAERISAYKNFLQENGQDPTVLENMAKDHLSDIGDKSPNPVAAIEKAWRKMSPEYRASMFSPETITNVEDALARTRQAKAPLEVMGTQMKGGSQTAAKIAMEKALSLSGVKGAVGGVVGSMLGGPIGGLAGGATGVMMEKMAQAKALENAKATLNNPITIEPQAPKVPISQKVGAALSNAKSAAGNALRVPIPATPSIPPYILDLVRKAAARPSFAGNGQ